MTFVHIRNISGVNKLILTKLFAQFFGVKIFVDKNFLGPNFFRPKFCSDPKTFLNPNLTNNFSGSKCFQTKNFIQTKKKCSDPKFKIQKYFSDLKFIQTQNIFGLQNLFLTLNFSVGLKFLWIHNFCLGKA